MAVSSDFQTLAGLWTVFSAFSFSLCVYIILASSSYVDDLFRLWCSGMPFWVWNCAL